jgi:hypothetical protein
MSPSQIESLLMMFTVIFVVIIVMLTVNEFGANAMTLILSSILLSGLLERHYLAATLDKRQEGDVKFKIDDRNPGLGIGSNGGLIGMSLFDLDAYYNVNKEQLQFPGWNKERKTTGHISDIMVRLVVTIVLLCYFVKSGIFKMENFNPLKRMMMS